MKESAPKKSPDKKENFLDKPISISRRNFLGMGVAAAGAYALKDWHDYRNEELSQYEGPKRLQEIIDLMEILDIHLPNDTLYGFTFPSTKEMGLKFKQALTTKVGTPPIPTLIIIQEKIPQSTIGSLVHRDRGITAPRISRGIDSNSPSFLHLPEYSQTHSVQESIPYIYHEGVHLFYQEGHAGEPERVFENENFANIANVLLDKFFKASNKATVAYDEAVANNKPEIWETYLKELYKLAPDCCEQKLNTELRD